MQLACGLFNSNDTIYKWYIRTDDHENDCMRAREFNHKNTSILARIWTTTSIKMYTTMTDENGIVKYVIIIIIKSNLQCVIIWFDKLFIVQLSTLGLCHLGSPFPLLLMFKFNSNQRQCVTYVLHFKVDPKWIYTWIFAKTWL